MALKFDGALTFRAVPVIAVLAPENTALAENVLTPVTAKAAVTFNAVPVMAVLAPESVVFAEKVVGPENTEVADWEMLDVNTTLPPLNDTLAVANTTLAENVGRPVKDVLAENVVLPLNVASVLKTALEETFNAPPASDVLADDTENKAPVATTFDDMFKLAAAATVPPRIVVVVRVVAPNVPVTKPLPTLKSPLAVGPTVTT